MTKLYPGATDPIVASRTHPKWGGQRFREDPPYEPIPLDSKVAAAERMLAHMAEHDIKDDPNGLFAITAGLGGSDELGTVRDLYREILVEREALADVDPLQYETGADYKAALSAVANRLVVNDWLDGLKAQYKVSTFAELKAALQPGE